MNHIKKLQTRLDEVSDEKTRNWFESYLKNVISYRGVKTPVVAKIVISFGNVIGEKCRRLKYVLEDWFDLLEV